MHDEDLEKLIVLREQSMKLSLTNLNLNSFSLLSKAFTFNNLQVKQIHWNGSESNLVEFVRTNDRVRPVDQLEELERRLSGKHFRCYGVFHEKVSMPVSFVFIKLYNGLADTLPNLLYADIVEEEVNSCVFYSISSPVRGLNGIEFGSNLIKSVTKIIQQEHPQIRIFSTFSPIPMFRHWLHKHHPHLTKLTQEQVHRHKSELLAKCGKYLEKGATHDPVAKFHFRNGATLGRINFAADMSENSFKQSYGLQVNYIYYQ